MVSVVAVARDTCGGDQGERLHQSLAATLAVVLDVLAVRDGKPQSCCPWRLVVILATELVATWPCVTAAVASVVELTAATAVTVEVAAATAELLAELLAVVLAVVLAVLLVVLLAVVLTLALAAALAVPLPVALVATLPMP